MFSRPFAHLSIISASNILIAAREPFINTFTVKLSAPLLALFTTCAKNFHLSHVVVGGFSSTCSRSISTVSSQDLTNTPKDIATKPLGDQLLELKSFLCSHLERVILHSS